LFQFLEPTFHLLFSVSVSLAELEYVSRTSLGEMTGEILIEKSLEYSSTNPPAGPLRGARERAPLSIQNESELTTSLLLIVLIAIQVAALTEFLTKWTEPSPKRVLIPP
jgi:hypothetical protein